MIYGFCLFLEAKLEVDKSLNETKTGMKSKETVRFEGHFIELMGIKSQEFYTFYFLLEHICTPLKLFQLNEVT